MKAQAAIMLCVLGIALSAIFVSNTLAADRAESDIERPNIILLMGDDHGWEETGYNGHPDLKTPVRLYLHGLSEALQGLGEGVFR